MAKQKKFRLLRTILQALGLSKESTDDVMVWVSNQITNDTANTTSPAIPTHIPMPPSFAGKGKTRLPYVLRENFLTPAELNFYRILMTIVSDDVIVFTKVGLGDIFNVRSKDRSEFQTFRNKIDRKHVDFLLCDAHSVMPIVGIELDDSSHRRKDRQERDRFVDAIFEVSNLPLVHIPVRESYVTKKLQRILSPYLDVSLSSYTPSEAQNIPLCPKCGSLMVHRKARRGKHVGNEFWGCSNYPHCRGVLEIENKSKIEN